MKQLFDKPIQSESQREITLKQGKRKKQKIPVAMREAIWIKHMGRVFEGKCPTQWCHNTITVFDFHSGHDIPESKGGPTTVDNLIPLCARCNTSMSNDYTFQQWNVLAKPIVPAPAPAQQPPPRRSWFMCFMTKTK